MTAPAQTVVSFTVPRVDQGQLHSQIPVIGVKSGAQLNTSDTGFIDINGAKVTPVGLEINQIVHVQLVNSRIPVPGLIASAEADLDRTAFFWVEVGISGIGAPKAEGFQRIVKIVESGSAEGGAITHPHAVGAVEEVPQCDTTGFLATISFVVITTQGELHVGGAEVQAKLTKQGRIITAVFVKIRGTVHLIELQLSTNR